MTDQAVMELNPQLGGRGACESVGVSQAGYYRRHRQSPAPARPEPVPHRQRHQPRALSSLPSSRPSSRAQENRIDFVEGVATALTPLAFYEVVMAKAFRTLVDDRTEVSVETGLRAAEKLQSVLDGREQGTDVLELKVQPDRIGEAVRAVVPQSMWAAIITKLEELEQHPEPLDVEADSIDDADDDPYDPTEFIDDDDEF